MINEQGAFYKQYSKEWEEVTASLKNSGIDLSKIMITQEDAKHDTRASKRDS